MPYYNNYSQTQNGFKEYKNDPTKPYISFFDLKNDKEEAIVRFLYDDPVELVTYNTHRKSINGKGRNIVCNKNPNDNSSSCYFCDRGDKIQEKIFIKLIQYVQDENGNIKPIAKIWERSGAYKTRLINLFNNYGRLSDVVFKITRNGAKGDQKTSYDIMFANPIVYKPELYIKDTSLFSNFDINKSYFITRRSNEKMAELDQNTNQQPQQNTNTIDPSRVIPTSEPQQQPIYNNYTPNNQSVEQQSRMYNPVYTNYDNQTPRTVFNNNQTNGEPPRRVF